MQKPKAATGLLHNLEHLGMQADCKGNFCNVTPIPAALTLEEAMALDNLTPEFKKAIKTCLEDRKGTVEYTGNIKIKIGGHAAAGMVPGAPK